MATQNKTAKGAGSGAKVKLTDMKPQKDAKGGKKAGKNKLSQSIMGGGVLGSRGRQSTTSQIRRHED